jgi:hypothetical protein
VADHHARGCPPLPDSARFLNRFLAPLDTFITATEERIDEIEGDVIHYEDMLRRYEQNGIADVPARIVLKRVGRKAPTLPQEIFAYISDPESDRITAELNAGADRVFTLTARPEDPDSLREVLRLDRRRVELLRRFLLPYRALRLRIISKLDDAETAAEGGREDATAKAAEISPASKKAKRSTERGEGRVKLIAVLTKHHKYADGGCLNLEPIGNNELARQARVSESTASAFFRKEFGGHTKYRATCGNATKLVSSLKVLNQEFSPHLLFGRNPPGEGERGDEE